MCETSLVSGHTRARARQARYPTPIVHHKSHGAVEHLMKRYHIQLGLLPKQRVNRETWTRQTCTARSVESTSARASSWHKLIKHTASPKETRQTSQRRRRMMAEGVDSITFLLRRCWRTIPGLRGQTFTILNHFLREKIENIFLNPGHWQRRQVGGWTEVDMGPLAGNMKDVARHGAGGEIGWWRSWMSVQLSDDIPRMMWARNAQREMNNKLMF